MKDRDPAHPCRRHDYYNLYCKKWQPAPDQETAHRRGLWSIFGEYVPNNLQTNILDVGCGTGHWLMTLLERGYEHSEGIDINPHHCQVCWNRGLYVTLADDASEFLETCDRKYGLITMFDVLEHMPKQDQIEVLIQCREILLDEGTIVCTVPNANSIVGARWRYNDWTHETSFTEDSLSYVLSAAGFDDIRINQQDIKWPRMPWLLRPSVLIYCWRRYQRWKYRFLLYAEIGKQAWHIPLSYNLIGVGTRKADRE